MKRLILWVALVGPFLYACQPAPPPEEAPPIGPETIVPAPDATAAEPAADDSSWRLVTGPDDAKVKVRCFFPMNDDHQWVKDLNAKIAATYPGEVQVEHIDWFSEEGGRVHEQAGIPPCSVYQVDEQTVAQKSQALGNWTEASLMAAVDEAVKAAYGDAAVVAPQEEKTDAEAGDAAAAEPAADSMPAADQHTGE